MEPPPRPADAGLPDAEQQVIDALVRARPPAGPPPLLDLGDDAAILAPTAHPMAWTVDTLVEGRHWDARLSSADVGFKALAVSVSDLAATGARAAHALLSLALPSPDPTWIDGFARGLAEALARWDVRLVGGDTVRTDGPRVVGLTVGGPVLHRALSRRGARPGDDLWVTGVPGLAGAGWRRADPPAAALAALRRPDPPVAFALALSRAGLARAAMDLSDGLGADVPRLARASGVRLVVVPAALPTHPALADDPLGHAFAGGDDYALLWCAAPADRPRIEALARACGVAATRIGHAEHGAGAALPDGRWPGGFAHFGEDSR